MKTVFIGLGSNLGDRGKNLRSALAQLEISRVKILCASSIYETEPIGFKNQLSFLNMVVKAKTQLSVAKLLLKLCEVERLLGRIRGKDMSKWGPRVIDLDTLFYGDEIIVKPDLIIPHPRAHERRFVLIPMVEIAPRLRHPVLKKTLRELLKECGDKGKVLPWNPSVII